MWLQSNIWKLQAFRFVRSFLVMIPVITVFYHALGMNQSQIFWSQIAFSIALFLFEIPTGYISDRIGRKKTIIISAYLTVLSMAMYVLSEGFWWIIMAEVVMGIGASFLSGTDSSMLYDTLNELGEKSQFKKYVNQRQMISGISEWLAGLVAACIMSSWAVKHLWTTIHTPIFMEFFCMIPLIFLAHTLVETHIHKPEVRHPFLKDIGGIIRYTLHENRNILWLILYSGIIGSSTLTFVWMIQPYLLSQDIPLGWFGLIWAVLNMSLAFFGFFTHRYEQLLGFRNALIGCLIMTIMGNIIIWFVPSILAGASIFLMYAVRTWCNPLIEEAIHNLSKPSMRATIQSINGMMFRVIFSIVSPFIGWIFDIYSMNTAFIVLAIFASVSGIVCICMLIKHRAI